MPDTGARPLPLQLVTPALHISDSYFEKNIEKNMGEGDERKPLLKTGEGSVRVPFFSFFGCAPRVPYPGSVKLDRVEFV